MSDWDEDTTITMQNLDSARAAVTEAAKHFERAKKELE